MIYRTKTEVIEQNIPSTSAFYGTIDGNKWWKIVDHFVETYKKDRQPRNYKQISFSAYTSESAAKKAIGRRDDSRK